MFLKYLQFILVCRSEVSVINRYPSSCFKSIVIGLCEILPFNSVFDLLFSKVLNYADLFRLSFICQFGY